MAYVFTIFSVVGWVWALVFGVFLLVRLRRRENGCGFPVQVVEQHEKQ
jgi:hypothetical protein